MSSFVEIGKIGEKGVFILVLLFTITIHEYSHGLCALFFGDRTAQSVGRLSLNPLRHIDPLWTVLFPFLLYRMGLPVVGMARPVPVNFLNLRNPRRHMIWVALAGPLSNFIFAGALSFFYHLVLWEPILYGIYLNLGLAIFNLIPIPPLDGSKILMGLGGRRVAIFLAGFERYGFFIVLLLVWLGVLWSLLFPIFHFFCRIYGVPVRSFGA